MTAGPRLADALLPRLPSAVETPGFDRSAVAPGIVHLGLGAFHRAHQAVFVDDCLNAGESTWGIVGASLRSADTRNALAPQDGLYTLSVVDGSGERLRVVGSILSTLVAPENPGALLDALCDPRTRIVTLTVTEKAYLRNSAGNLDERHPEVVWDLANPDRPKSLYGFLAEAIARRRAAGTVPFTILSCDNLPANGATLRKLLVAFAGMRDRELGRYVAEDIAFPSSMVDRIVPATTDSDRERISAALGATDAWPVTTEPFRQWVIEDRFPGGRPALERFGVEMVKDVAPFEDMKLRLLNGSHSAIAYLGLLSGHETVAAAFGDPAIRSFVGRLWSEAIPTLPTDAGLRPEAYIDELAKRFDNPALKHRTAQIANDGSQKLPQRIIATAIDRLRTGAGADHLMLAPAAWIAACEARGNSLPAGHFTDPLDAALGAIFAKSLGAAETVDEVFGAAGFAAGSDNLATLKRTAARHLASLRRNGAAATLQELGS
ncbi:mannitol dehydrogenase family protein [Aminobacter sp. AP02]|uniref:mannitol dehydrogenase family protein n=1 Tax=Aminobacter sp. AP02 TaxID=2135737 RepID=UPI000D6C91B9|nr:mannitol dehydrogenase family protein [Aminobacter sp. AP02]